MTENWKRPEFGPLGTILILTFGFVMVVALASVLQSLPENIMDWRSGRELRVLPVSVGAIVCLSLGLAWIVWAFWPGATVLPHWPYPEYRLYNYENCSIESRRLLDEAHGNADMARHHEIVDRLEWLSARMRSLR